MTRAESTYAFFLFLTYDGFGWKGFNPCRDAYFLGDNGMAKIAISGRNLHEVMMRQRNPFPGTSSYLSYPEHRIGTEIEGGRITLALPPLLAVELYRSAVIPQEEGGRSL
jgi:hypothetical protein